MALNVMAKMWGYIRTEICRNFYYYRQIWTGNKESFLICWRAGLESLDKAFLETKSRPGFYKRICRIVATNRPVFINVWQIFELFFEAMFLTIELTIGQNDKQTFEDKNCKGLSVLMCLVKSTYIYICILTRTFKLCMF